MKILHITPSYEPAWHLGGVVRSLGQLCRGLVRLGVEVTVYTTDSGRDRRLKVPVNQAVEVDGVTVHYFKTDISLRFAYSRALHRACRDMAGKFDLIHLTAFWCYPGIVGGHFARRWSIPYVISTAGTVRPSAMRHKSWKKWLYMASFEMRNMRGAAAIRCVTPMEQQQNVYLPISTPSFVVPNGINYLESPAIPRRAEARRQLGIAADEFVGLFVGRLALVKRIDLMIKALSQAKNRGILATLLIAGPDWGELAKLKSLVQKLGLDDQVRFLGPVPPETRDLLLAATDFLALTSEEESFGYAAVEALFARRPVIVSEGVGIAPIVAAEKAGLVIPLDEAAMSQAMETMARNQELMAQMGDNAFHCAGEHFDITAVSQKMARAYNDILTGKRSVGLSWSDTESRLREHNNP